MPLLTGFQEADEPDFRAPASIGSDDTVAQALDSGAPPSAAKLDLEFPGAGMQVLSAPRSLAELFGSASPK